MLRKHLICYLLVSLLLVPVLWSQERAATRPSIPGGPKQALVIGNSAYTHTSPLKNPVNDAKSIGNTLQQLGFEVTTLLDVNQRQMEQALRRFGSRLRDQNGVGLFYYAGHGMQVSGENYLLPVDINPSTETDVRYDAIPVGKLLGQMDAAGNGMNIVILDACRNNPFARSFRSESRGLAQVIAPTGSFISYATAPGDVAADGDGDNGLFTAKLLTHMRTPGLKLEDVFKRVRADVQRESNDKQVPWDSSSVTGDFFFVPPVEEVVVSVPTEQPSTEASKLDIAERAWSMIEQSENPEIFRAFIEKFPDTPQRQLAELKLLLLPSAPVESKDNALPNGDASGTVNLYGSNPSQTQLSDTGSNSRYSWTAETVEDPLRKLVWRRKDAGEMSFEEAKRYCENFVLDGVRDWRLPEIAELRELFIGAGTEQDMIRRVFPIPQGFYWTKSQLGSGIWYHNPWTGNGATIETVFKPNIFYHTLCTRDSGVTTSVPPGTVNLYNSTSSSSKTEKNEIQSSFQKGMEYSSYQKISESTGKVIGCGFFHVGCEEKALTFPGYQSDFHLKGYRRVNLWGKDRPWTDTELQLKNGDRVYLYGTGEVTTCSHSSCSRRGPQNLNKGSLSYKISEGASPRNLNRFTRIRYGSSGFKSWLQAPSNGALYLSVRDWNTYPPPSNYYDDNSGVYILDIFVIDPDQEEGFNRFKDALFKANPNDSNAKAYLGR